jgi:hypothetical protein
VKIRAEIEEKCESIDSEAKGKLQGWTETETELATEVSKTFGIVITVTIGSENKRKLDEKDLILLNYFEKVKNNT